MEKQKLIYVESKALFSPSEVSDKAIVFIKDTKEIWTHGVYFSCSGTWASPITLSLTGDTTGSVSIDGSGNASIATTTRYLSGNISITDANNAANTQQHKIAYYARIGRDASNLFPASNNANGILSLNVHDYSYTYLLGFSSNGNIYYRRRNGGTWETSWKTILSSTNYTNFPHTFASLTNKPTTLSGYGITDCIPIISGRVTPDTDLSTLGMTTTGAKLSVSYTSDSGSPSWLYLYSNFLMFRSTVDTYGGIATATFHEYVTFIGGRNPETTTNNVPNWWFRIKGSSGTTYDLNSILNSINNLDSNYLRKSGGTMTGILTLTTDTAYINDTQSGSAIFGTVSTSNTFTGISGLETIFAGRLTNMVLRTSGDNLYHYNHSKSARYLILDKNNYSSYALPLSGGTMTGALNFANNTWNKVGDDAYMGDCNVAGMIGIKGSNAATPGFAMYNTAGTLLGKLYARGSDLYWSGVKLLTSTGSAKEAYLEWGGQNLASNSSPIDAILEPLLGANRLAFLSPDAIDIEYSQDGGTTWLNYNATDAQKVSLFCGGGNYSNFYLGGNSSTDPSIDRTPWRLRITISAIGYSLSCQFIKFLIYTTDVRNTTYCLLLGRKYSDYQNNVDTWVTFLTARIAGWSGWNTINHPNGIILPNTATYAQLRFEFYMTSLGTTGRASIISRIEGFAHKCWSWPSNMAGYGNIYSYDWQLNVTFPAKVTATGGFSGNLTGDVTGNLTGNADTASNISTVNPILALPFEKNTIQVVSNPLGALAEQLGTAAAITHALRFNWYNTAYEIGNVRGGASNSLGFGVTYGNNNLCLLVKTDGTYSPYGFIGDLTGNAATANKWAIARTITLTGDVTGSVTLDGSSNVTLTTTTSGTGTTSFLKCPDKRNSYPALIVTSGGNIGAAFISTSTLGLSEGYYCDTLILRGYATHTAGYENALFFNKQNSSVYHSQYTFGSTTTWGTMYKFLDSNNYSSYALPLRGGTITGKLTMLANSLANLPLIYRTDGAYLSGIRFLNTVGYLGSIGMNTESGSLLILDTSGTLYPILDSRNYNNYAAAKSHTHPWSDITSKPSLLGAMANPIFYPYANDNKLGAYISTINNRFYSADLRYTVTTTNFMSGSVHYLFDDNYDNRMQIDKGTTATITIEGYNFVYNNGYIILYFYLYNAYPLKFPKSITAKATNSSGTVFTLNRATAIESGNTIAFSIGLEYLTKIEFTIVSLDDAYCGITNIDYYSRRTENSARDCAVVTKYNANTLYHNLTAPKYIVSGGTSSQFLKADGSLDSNTYLPLSGGTMTGAITLTSGSDAANAKTALSFIKSSDKSEQARIGTDITNGLGLYARGTIYIRPNVTLGSGSTNGLVISNSSFTYNGNAVLTSSNYTNYTIGYANALMNYKGYAGVISDGKLYYNNTLQFARFVQHDNSGRFSYELIAELTNYGTGTNTSYITYGISGFMWAWREGNGANSGAYPITAIVNVGPAILLNMLRIPVTTNALIPFVVKYNGKYYIALRKKGSSTTFYFMGAKFNLLTTSIIVDDASLIEEVAGPITETSTAKYYYNNGNPQEYLHAGNYKNFYPIKLLYPRTLWGQSFDGTGNVSGDMTGVGIINTILNLKSKSGNASLYLETVTASTDYAHLFVTNKNDKNNVSRPLILQNGYGNVGIGTNSPAYKLHVAGDIYTTTGFKKNGSSNSYVLLGGGGHKAVSDFTMKELKTTTSISGNTDQWSIILEQSYPADHWYDIVNTFLVEGTQFGSGFLSFYANWLATSSAFNDYITEVYFNGTMRGETTAAFGGSNRDINDYLRIYIDKTNYKLLVYANHYNGKIVRIKRINYNEIGTSGFPNGGILVEHFNDKGTIVSLPTESSTMTRVLIKTHYNHDRTIKTSKSIYASSFYENSDIRLKENIRGIDLSDLTKLVDLVQFNFKDSDTKKYGVIAQLLELVGLQNLVYENDGKKAVDYISLLVLEIQRLRNEIGELKLEIHKKS